MPGFVGFPEILLLGLVVLLVFGPKRLPEMGRSLGRGLREFKDSVTNDKDEERFAVPVASISEAPDVAGAPTITLGDPELVPVAANPIQHDSKVA